MKTLSSLFSFILAIVPLTQFGFAQNSLLDGAQTISIDLTVNDVVYDRIQDVLYASVPSSAGSPYANTLATIDPSTGDVLSSTFVGSEPNALAISDDASRVYIGVDGDTAIRWWQPHDNQLGPLRSLGNAVAHNIAVVPGRTETVVVSVDGLGSTANGDLRVFDDKTVVDANEGFADPNHIGFINETTMYGFDDSNTGFRASSYELSGLNLQLSFSISGVVNQFIVESTLSTDGNIYFTDGTVIDGLTLFGLGTFVHGLNNGRTLVAAVPSLAYTYFVGPSEGINMVMKVFDTQTFLQLDSVELDIPSSMAENRGEMVLAGENRMAFVWKPSQFDGPGGAGALHIVSGIPVSNHSLGDVNCDGAVNLLDVQPFVDALNSGVFAPKADINRDGLVNMLDVDPFLDLLAGN